MYFINKINSFLIFKNLKMNWNLGYLERMKYTCILGYIDQNYESILTMRKAIKVIIPFYTLW